MRTVLISLYPVSNIGGGERYTLDTIRSIQAAGDECRAYAAVRPFPRHGYPQLLASQFTRITASEPHGVDLIVTLRDLIMELAKYDVIVIHQYLSSDVVFELISNCASDQVIILTNLGHEPLWPEFEAHFQPSTNCWFIEISEFSAQRASRMSKQAVSVTGALWRTNIAPFRVPKNVGQRIQRFCSVGRVLAHKGIEITIEGMPRDSELIVIGPQYDESYLGYLNSRRCGKAVTFVGIVPEQHKRQLIADSDALIASSHHRLYDGRIIKQAELLGLIIFESLSVNTFPITSDIAPFQEVMSNVELADFLYSESDAASLTDRIGYFRSCSSAQLAMKLARARELLTKQYLWDDYWLRVKALIGI